MGDAFAAGGDTPTAQLPEGDQGIAILEAISMGATAAGGMDALLHPTTFEGLDADPSSGQRFEAELAYGFPAHNHQLTLTPAVALALSPTSRNTSLLWSLAPSPWHPMPSHSRGNPMATLPGG